jgi:general secretion pathway protein G
MRKSWFSLTELALLGVVVALILATTIPPRLVSRPEADSIAANVRIRDFGTALDLFKEDNGVYPKGKDGLNELIVKPSEAGKDWHEYLDSIPLDPWGHAYIYECPGIHRPDSYDLSSAGPDGRAGTADDITNWQPTGH